MTQEEKQLLLQDLSARLPYEPMCEFTDTEDDFCKTTNKLGYSLRDFVAGKIIIKPYLRPISSMTEEEEWKYNYIKENHTNWEAYDYLNSIHIDYRGLISMGFAIEAPEGMYN